MDKYTEGKPTEEQWKAIVDDDEKFDYSCAVDDGADDPSGESDLEELEHNSDGHGDHNDDGINPFEIDPDNLYDFKN